MLNVHVGMQDDTDVQVALWTSWCTWVMVQMHGLQCRHGQAVSTGERAAARAEARSSSKWGMGVGVGAVTAVSTARADRTEAGRASSSSRSSRQWAGGGVKQG